MYWSGSPYVHKSVFSALTFLKLHIDCHTHSFILEEVKLQKRFYVCILVLRAS